MEFLAKNYLNRNDLESVIRAEVGDNIEKNRQEKNTIKGTRQELKKLFLSDTSMVFGCKIIITDSPTTQILADKLKEKKK